MDLRSFPGGKGNGHVVPVKTDGIPIIGQAFQVRGGFPTVSLQCGCPAKEPILLIGNSPGQCPSCRRMFVCALFEFNAQTGQIKVNVALARPVEGPEAAPEEPVS